MNGRGGGAGWASARAGGPSLLTLRSAGDHGCHRVTKLLPSDANREDGWLSWACLFTAVMVCLFTARVCAVVLVSVGFRGGAHCHGCERSRRFHCHLVVFVQVAHWHETERSHPVPRRASGPGGALARHRDLPALLDARAARPDQAAVRLGVRRRTSTRWSGSAGCSRSPPWTSTTNTTRGDHDPSLRRPADRAAPTPGGRLSPVATQEPAPV
ncbi:hypothetical protein OV450_4680 [Actinobacteria bacterium OV450]|nr:hypothetical protein OV450_4680 [Actinobacteria bacterium OV450]